ncbi:hypothetical protein NL676_016945 [Syzygium grande]|nr:hypothetical protein NL676_016945 [Syzygium grande]
MAVSPPVARALILSFAFLLFLNLRPISPSAVGSDPGVPGCAGDYYQEKFRRRASPGKAPPGEAGGRRSRSLCSPICTSGRTPGRTGGPARTSTTSSDSASVVDRPDPGNCKDSSLYLCFENLSVPWWASSKQKNAGHFVVYLGDVITANNIPIANARSYWNPALSPTRSRGIPFASVFGNHDDALFVWPLERFSAPSIHLIHCPVANSSFSGDCSFRGTQRLQLMKNEIEQNALSYSSKGPEDLVPELIFWHIPSKAYEKVAPWIGVRKPCVGSFNKETVASQEAEAGIMEILEKRPSVMAVFVGHNRGLDWCCPYKKLWLCFARHSRYGGYGNWP